MRKKKQLTEAEWLSSRAPRAMLASLEGRVSERKLRLFACACCRAVWHLFTDERERRAVEVGERFADGQATKAELAEAAREVNLYSYSGKCQNRDLASAAHWAAVNNSSAQNVWAAAEECPHYTRCVDRSGKLISLHVRLLHCIFGNPFRPVPPLPASWLAWNGGIVGKLAHVIYHERDFARLPILADALADAGCDDKDILDHCRRPGPHARGCWPLDLLLDKG